MLSDNIRGKMYGFALYYLDTVAVSGFFHMSTLLVPELVHDAIPSLLGKNSHNM